MLSRYKLSRFLRFFLMVAIGIALIVVALLPTATRASSDFNYTIRVNYNVQSSGVTHVTETYTIANNTSNKYLESLELSTPTDEVNDLSVSYTDGGHIPTTVEKQKTNDHSYNYEFQKIILNFPRRVIGNGSAATFSVSYNTSKLVESKGDAHIVYIPAIAGDNADSYSVSLTVPPDFGPVHGVGAPIPPETKQGGQRQFGFNRKDLTDHSIAVLFGDYTTYQANFNFPLNNDTNLTKTFTVALPPNMPSQEVFINSITPAPTGTSLDSDGNIWATFSVPANTKTTVQTDILAKIKYLQYDLSKSGTKADIPSDLIARYTGSTKYWQSNNPTIQKKAKELTEGKKTVAEQVQAINNYVIDTLSYNSDKIKYNVRQGAVQAIADPNNVVCLEYSDLTIALLRSAGIPARMPIGYGYSGNLKSSSSVADSLHSWVETYVPNIGWMNVDPTWGEKFNNFGYSDLDHFAFALWGADDSQPVAIQNNARETDYQYENTTLRYTTFQPKVSDDAKLSATKWVVLPFVSVLSYNGKNLSTVATTELVVMATTSGSSTQRALGSLAPGQSFWGLLGDFGSGFSAPSDVKLANKDSSQALSTTRTSQNFLPIIIISIGVIIIFIYKMVQLLSKRSENNRPKEPKMHDEDDKAKPKSSK